MSESFPRVRGRCPACGNATLFVGARGYLTCSWMECREPGAADEMLNTRGAVRALVEAVKRAVDHDSVDTATCEDCDYEDGMCDVATELWHWVYVARAALPEIKEVARRG